jgi:hypothetical protein
MQRPPYPRVVTTSIAVIAALAVASPAVSTARAQADRTPGLSDQVPADKTPDISEQKLDAAVAAIKQIASVKADYEKKLEEAPQSDRERIADEAESAIVRAVTDNGLSVKEYESIMVVAQNNPEVRQKIIRKIRPSE